MEEVVHLRGGVYGALFLQLLISWAFFLLACGRHLAAQQLLTNRACCLCRYQRGWWQPTMYFACCLPKRTWRWI